MPRFVRISNRTRGTVLAERCRVASSLRDRMVGLLRSTEGDAATGLLIERSQSIHMFFMQYPIDAAFISASGQITRTVARLRPWRVVAWARGAQDCLEVAAGALAASGTRAGDQLEITDVP